MSIPAGKTSENITIARYIIAKSLLFPQSLASRKIEFCIDSPTISRPPSEPTSVIRAPGYDYLRAEM